MRRFTEFLLRQDILLDILVEDDLHSVTAGVDGKFNTLDIKFANGDRWACIRNRPYGKNQWAVTERCV